RADGAVYDGRDTGTVVCPHADIKLFVTASPEVRAERRFKEFQAKGLQTSYEEVLKDIKARDERDSNRAAAPLKPAADAVILDTSALSIDDVIEKVCRIIDSK
ncbi:MAG: (d)CMP kinase, partial [Pseudomonadota bacterium]|nr:(d)CMP kinase [Pseudomonadota bacterium]